MFKKNDRPELFGFETELNKKQRDLLDVSKEKWFYKLILRNINENNFKPLYSEKASRPNVAINILVSALILEKLKGISYDELIESVMFDLRFKTALGLVSIDDMPFSRGTLFNIQNRILAISEVEGFVRCYHIGWDNYDEGGDMKEQVEDFKELYGCYPKSLLAESKYLTR